MPKITFVLANGKTRTITAQENQSIMQIALANNIPGIEGVCGGCVACATCHIKIPHPWKDRVDFADNEKTEEELDMLETTSDNDDSSRLGCQIKVTKALNGLLIVIP